MHLTDKCEYFQQNILKINPFSSTKSHIKIQISKLKNQWCIPQTISDSIDGNLRTCCMSKTFKKFPNPMKRLRHVDVTMTLTSSSVVIRGLPGGGLLFLLPDCRKHVFRR